MKSPNQQYLIAQELSKIEFNVASPGYTIIGYELNGEYMLGISSTIGMFTGEFIECIIKLCDEYGFNWYISDSCSADNNGSLFVMIY